MEIQNDKACFVLLWRMLERTRRLLAGHCKRFCIRNILKAWFDLEANDDFIWQVCHMCELEGMNELPRPSLYPRQHRELLRANANLSEHFKLGEMTKSNSHPEVYNIPSHEAIANLKRVCGWLEVRPFSNRHKVCFINA